MTSFSPFGSLTTCCGVCLTMEVFACGVNSPTSNSPSSRSVFIWKWVFVQNGLFSDARLVPIPDDVTCFAVVSAMGRTPFMCSVRKKDGRFANEREGSLGMVEMGAGSVVTRIEEFLVGV